MQPATSLLIAVLCKVMPCGAVLDCSKFNGSPVVVEMKIRVIATNRSENIGIFSMGPQGDAELAQLMVYLALEDENAKWRVKMAPGHKVIVFAPRGLGVKEVIIYSNSWKPSVTPIFGPPVQTK